MEIRKNLYYYRHEILFFILWFLANTGLATYKYFVIAKECDGVNLGYFKLIGDTNETCQAAQISCCKGFGDKQLDQFGRPCQFYCANPCNLLGRILGHLLNFHIGLTFLPILRNSIWSLLGKFPFERTVFFHRWIGGFTFILMLLHMITWWITYPVGSEGWICWGFTYYFKSDMFLGHLAFVFHATAAFFALNFFRRRYFELFYHTHFLYLGVIVFGVWHTFGVQSYNFKNLFDFKDDYFLLYLLVPFILYIIDRIIRFHRSRIVKAELVTLDPHITGEKVVKLVIKRQTKFQPGQYCFICIPELSYLQWHPFSISSSPAHPGILHFHIKNMGKRGWTERLYEISRLSMRKMKILVDGPYGSPSLKLNDFKSVVLMAGGVGVTPMMSMLQDLIERYKAYPNVTRVFFVWVMKQPEQVNWFSEFWEKIFPNPSEMKTNEITVGNISFVFSFHFTNNIKQEINLSADSPLIEKVEGVLKTSQVPVTACANGRPNIKQIFIDIRKLSIDKKINKVGVFSCGPQAFLKSIADSTYDSSDSKLDYELHEETFFL